MPASPRRPAPRPTRQRFEPRQRHRHADAAQERSSRDRRVVSVVTLIVAHATSPAAASVVSTAFVQELRAGDDALDQAAEAIAVRRQLRAHRFDQRCRPTASGCGPARRPAACGTGCRRNRPAAARGRRRAGPRRPCPSLPPGNVADASTGRPPRSFVAPLADRAVAFEHQAERVEPRVAAGAASCPRGAWRAARAAAGRASPRRAAARARRRAAAECARRAPASRPSSRASPGSSAGRARSSSGTPPSAAARRGRTCRASSTRTHVVGAAGDVGHAVVLRQRRVHERVLGVQEVEHRAVLAERRRGGSGPAPRTSPGAARCRTSGTARGRPRCAPRTGGSRASCRRTRWPGRARASSFSIRRACAHEHLGPLQLAGAATRQQLVVGHARPEEVARAGWPARSPTSGRTPIVRVRRDRCDSRSRATSARSTSVSRIASSWTSPSFSRSER